MTDFSGKKAIVLGGTSGIGLATTEMLRDAGARVIAGSRRECSIDGVECVTINVLVPGGPTDTRMVPESAPFEREALIPVNAMVPPTQWLASPVSDGVTGRRFVAALWDAEQPLDQAVRAAGAPIGWPDLTTNVVWPDG